MRTPRAATIAAALLSCALAHGAEESIDIAGLKVTVWSAPTPDRAPVLIFSHGFHGCATQSRFLMNAFADAGYLVAAPNHRDATCNGGGAWWFQQSQQPFRRAGSWSEDTYRDRANDIVALIDALRTDDRFEARLDMDRLGLVGHSLGGYTVLGLSGAWPGWKLNGVKAVVGLSPYTHPFIVNHTLAQLNVPVMYQGGTRDFGITPSLGKTDGAYEQSPAPKYFVEFEGAGHMAWTERRDAQHEVIVAYCLAFMNHYLKGERADALLTHAAAQVSDLRFVSDLGDSDSGPDPR